MMIISTDNTYAAPMYQTLDPCNLGINHSVCQKTAELPLSDSPVKAQILSRLAFNTLKTPVQSSHKL